MFIDTTVSGPLEFLTHRYSFPLSPLRPRNGGLWGWQGSTPVLTGTEAVDGAIATAVAVLAARRCSNTGVGVGCRRKRLAAPLLIATTPS